MHPQEPQEFDFTLEDIIREFSDSSEDDLLAYDTQPPAEPEPEPTPEPTPPAEPAGITSDTVRLDTVVTSPALQPLSQDTAVFEPVVVPEQMPELISEPVPVLEPIPEPDTTPDELKEPFSDDWEPEYEEPMGDYPQPIVFPSRNRQATLRKKLVAGPEKRYHDLLSDGLGKLQLAIFLHLILLLISAAGMILPQFVELQPGLLRLVVFAQLVIAMVASLMSCYRLLVGIGSLFRGRFSLNTLLFVTVAACIADGFFCLQTQRMPYTPALCLALLMAQWAEYQRRNALMGQMDTLRKALNVTAVVKLPNYYEGISGYVTQEGDPDSFMDEYYKTPAPEKRLDLFGLLALAAATVLTVFIGLRSDWQTAIQVLSATLLAAVPASSLIIISRPSALLTHRLNRLGAVLCGWKGIREADRVLAYPLTHQDLFPGEYAKLNGVKFYGSIDPGRVVAYTSALINQDGEGMMSVFSHLPRSRNIHQHQVTDFLAMPGGISGLVDGWTVLVGTQEFLTELGISIPEDVQMPQAVYASVNGQFSAVFALQYNRNKSSAAGLRTLCGYRNVKPVLTTCDFILTDQFIHSRLSVNVRHMIFPEREVRQHLAATPVPEDAPVVALVTKNGLAPKAYAVTGARVLRSTLNIGSAVHIFAGAAGLIAVAVLALNGAFDTLSALNLLGYSLTWLIPGILITEWTRYI